MKNFFLQTAYLLGQKSNCISCKVGAVIAKDKRIISTGYNGTPSGFINCCDHFPEYTDTDRYLHHEWSKMYEVHAEMNAILFAAKHGVKVEGAEIYTILQPCDDCLKNIIAVGLSKIYYVIAYDMSTKGNKLFNKIEIEIVNNQEIMDWIKNQDSIYNISKI